MPHFVLILWVKLLVVGRFQPQSNRFAMGVENKATGNSERNDSPELSVSPIQERGTTLANDEFFDLDGIVNQQKSNVIG